MSCTASWLQPRSVRNFWASLRVSRPASTGKAFEKNMIGQRFSKRTCTWSTPSRPSLCCIFECTAPLAPCTPAKQWALRTTYHVHPEAAAFADDLSLRQVFAPLPDVQPCLFGVIAVPCAFALGGQALAALVVHCWRGALRGPLACRAEVFLAVGSRSAASGRRSGTPPTSHLCHEAVDAAGVWRLSGQFHLLCVTRHTARRGGRAETTSLKYNIKLQRATSLASRHCPAHWWMYPRGRLTYAAPGHRRRAEAREGVLAGVDSGSLALHELENATPAALHFPEGGSARATDNPSAALPRGELWHSAREDLSASDLCSIGFESDTELSYASARGMLSCISPGRSQAAALRGSRMVCFGDAGRPETDEPVKVLPAEPPNMTFTDEHPLLTESVLDASKGEGDRSGGDEEHEISMRQRGSTHSHPESGRSGVGFVAYSRMDTETRSTPSGLLDSRIALAHFLDSSREASGWSDRRRLPQEEARPHRRDAGVRRRWNDISNRSKYGIWAALERRASAQRECEAHPHCCSEDSHKQGQERGDTLGGRASVTKGIRQVEGRCNAVRRFIDAVRSGDQTSVRRILAADSSLCSASLSNDVAGFTALHWAAKTNQADVCGALLDANADVDCRTRHGLTPLHSAALNGSGRAVKLLLARGADAKSTDCKGRTPENLASERISVLTQKAPNTCNVSQMNQTRSTRQSSLLECTAIFRLHLLVQELLDSPAAWTKENLIAILQLSGKKALSFSTRGT